MNLVIVLLTGLALSMDAFTVSVSKGMSIRNLKTGLGVKIALSFGIFQGIMPFLGWLLGVSFEKYIVTFDHWIALILLSYLGFNMIKGFFEDDEDDLSNESQSLTNKELFVLSIATSIDALAVGISFAFTDVNIYAICLSITTITFIMCLIGVFLGKKIGSIFSSYAEVLGGIILILIGLNIFNEHTGFISNFF